VIFVLVLRCCPPRPIEPTSGATGLRAPPLHSRRRHRHHARGVCDGRRTATPIAELLPAAAYYRGHGANTVNVLLVDIRAWDTLGEVSVLLVAATGVHRWCFGTGALERPPCLRCGSADIGPVPRWPSAVGGRCTWLRGSELRPAGPFAVLEVATRMIFPLIMMLSAYFFSQATTLLARVRRCLTAGLALVLRYLARRPLRTGRDTALAAGKISALAWLVGGHRGRLAVDGRAVLSSALIQLDVPVSARSSSSLALFFDLGVYLIVVGLVLDVLRSLGARVDVDMAQAAS